jgi:hypothetical protein
VSELQDLLQECSDTRTGKLRKGSIQASAGVSISVANLKQRKESRKKSDAEERPEAFGISGKLKSIRNRTRKSSRMEQGLRDSDFRANSVRSSEIMIHTSDDGDDRVEEEVQTVRDRNRQLLQRLTFQSSKSDK